MTAEMQEVDEAADRGCPVITYDFVSMRPPEQIFTELDELREKSPVYWNDFTEQGFWMLTRYAEVREAYQHPEIFSSDSVMVTDPNPAYRWIPTHVNPPEHAKYRRLLNTKFSPGTVATLEDTNRAWCAEIVAKFADRGHCDVVKEFASVFPTGVFLHILGLPLEDAEEFSGWVSTIFDGMRHPERQAESLAAMGEVQQYFVRVLADRREHPRDPETDFVSFLISSTMDGRPVTDEEVLNICGVLVLAGLDTMKSQLGLAFYHLARHPEDRRRLLAEPELLPTAVEEILRNYAIVMDGRKVAQDVEFHGCPMKKGDMVMLTLPSATRDPRAFEDAEEFVIDRKINAHVAFAAGPHRCLGAHLARQELQLALEEFHRAIPEYEIAPGVDVVVHGGQIAVDSLPLVWSK